jgi:protein-S-isoprenylcysteine O-methyltransferase Ste14
MQENLFGGQLTPDTALQYAKWLWTILAAVWLLMAFTTKRTKRRETVLERIRHILPLVIGFWLFFGKTFYLPWLHFRLLPNLPAIWWTGLLLTLLGVGFALWARLSLGSNWSGTVTLKDNHELIRKGLYSRVRHPIYSGILLGVIGTGMIHGQLRDLLGFLLLYASFYFKAKREESFLQQEFGSNFAEHQRQTGMFLPKFQ